MKFDYDIAISFAREDRTFAEDYANSLKSHGVKVFYDDYEAVDLWGKDLYQHLSDVYFKNSRYCAIIISKNYIEKLWTNHELKNAQARQFEQNGEYILPIKLDNSDVKGLLPTIGYLDANKKKIEEISKLTLKKLNKNRKKATSVIIRENLDNITHEYLSENPMFSENQSKEFINSKLTNIQNWWNKATLKSILSFPTKKANYIRGISELNIVKFEKRLTLIISIASQLDESLTCQLINKPSQDSYDNIIKEMHNYQPLDFNTEYNLLDEKTINYALPNSYKKIVCNYCEGKNIVYEECPNCKGKGKIKKDDEFEECTECEGTQLIKRKCSKCSNGHWDSHKRSVRKVYPKKEILLSFNELDSFNVLKVDIPYENATIIKEFIQLEFIDKLPFQLGKKEFSNTETVNKNISNFNNAIKHKLNRKIASVSDITELVKDANYLHENDSNEFYSDASDILISDFTANKHGIIIEVLPIYCLTYKRVLNHKTGIFSKKDIESHLEGAIYFNDKGVFHHVENKIKDIVY